MKIGMVTYSFYEMDTRVIRYAESLVKRGDQVDVFALKGEDQSQLEVIRGVNLFRIQERAYNEGTLFSYLYRTFKFMLRCAWLLVQNHMRNPYDLIHVHNVPDFMVFSAIYPKLRGVRIILDIHDILPEFFALKFGASTKGKLFEWVALVEKLSMAFANQVIVSNHIWEQRLLSRSISRGKCSVILNYPEETAFSRQTESPRKREKFVILYPGTLLQQQGVDIALKAFALISRDVPEAEFYIYGEGNKRSELEALSRELGLNGKVIFGGSISAHEVRRIMPQADLGIEPKRDGLFSGEALSMKILEFMAEGVPVIASNTKAHKYYFNDSVIKFFEAGDEKDLAKCMLQLIKDNKLRKKLVSNASRFIQEYTWDKRKHEFLKLVDSLTG